MFYTAGHMYEYLIILTMPTLSNNVESGDKEDKSNAEAIPLPEFFLPPSFLLPFQQLQIITPPTGGCYSYLSLPYD